MKRSIKAKILGATIGIGLLLCSQIAAIASPTYGSDVTTSGIYKYGYAWTRSSGQSVRARIVIGGALSDKNDFGYVQTQQIHDLYYCTAYIAHWANGVEIANYTK